MFPFLEHPTSGDLTRSGQHSILTALLSKPYHANPSFP